MPKANYGRKSSFGLLSPEVQSLGQQSKGVGQEHRWAESPHLELEAGRRVWWFESQ